MSLGNTWEKKFQAALLAKPSDKTLDVDALKVEKVVPPQCDAFCLFV